MSPSRADLTREALRRTSLLLEVSPRVLDSLDGSEPDMSKKVKRKPLKTRSWIAVSAHFRKAGAMGPTPRAEARRERKAARQTLRGIDPQGEADMTYGTVVTGNTPPSALSFVWRIPLAALLAPGYLCLLPLIAIEDRLRRRARVRRAARTGENA